MGVLIPDRVAESPLSKLLVRNGLTQIHQGKVRNTYELPDHPDLLFQLVTNRISIFDFVLPALVRSKGEVLTAMTIFWLTKVLKDFPHHLVAFGSNIDDFLPGNLRANPELQRRALVVKKLEILPIEWIVRGFLTGSGWAAYQESEQVCGIPLPAGLHDGAKLPHPIFTPTTKAEVGHDLHLSAEDVIAKHGEKPRDLALSIYARALAYAESRGIIIADTKFEFGVEEILADEVLTPDSSRFWKRDEWEEAVSRRKSPPGHDKELVRTWGKGITTPFLFGRGKRIVGIHKLDPTHGGHIAFVHDELRVPNCVLSNTRWRYRNIFQMLTGQELEKFQKSKMGIAV